MRLCFKFVQTMMLSDICVQCAVRSTIALRSFGQNKRCARLVLSACPSWRCTLPGQCLLSFHWSCHLCHSRVTVCLARSTTCAPAPCRPPMTLYDASNASRPPTPSHAALSVPLIAWSCPIWSRLALLSQPTLRGSRLFPSYAVLSVPLIAWSCPIRSRLALLSQPTLRGSRLFQSYAVLSVPLIAWSCPIWSPLALLS